LCAHELGEKGASRSTVSIKQLFKNLAKYKIFVKTTNQNDVLSRKWLSEVGPTSISCNIRTEAIGGIASSEGVVQVPSHNVGEIVALKNVGRKLRVE
jgi:hypothetical protein